MKYMRVIASTKLKYPLNINKNVKSSAIVTKKRGFKLLKIRIELKLVTKASNKEKRYLH